MAVAARPGTRRRVVGRTNRGRRRIVVLHRPRSGDLVPAAVLYDGSGGGLASSDAGRCHHRRAGRRRDDVSWIFFPRLGALSALLLEPPNEFPPFPLAPN